MKAPTQGRTEARRSRADALLHPCPGWRLRRIGGSFLIRAVAQAACDQSIAVDEGVDRGDRLAIFLQPTALLLRTNDRAQTALQGFRHVDAQAARFVEQFGVDEQIYGALLGGTLPEHGATLL